MFLDWLQYWDVVRDAGWWDETAEEIEVCAKEIRGFEGSDKAQAIWTQQQKQRRSTQNVQNPDSS